MPANDNIGSAQVISGSSGSVTGDNTGSTLEANEGTCLYTGLGYGGGCTDWYAWTAPADGDVTFTTSAAGGSPIGDTILTVIDGTNFSTATVVAQNDDIGGGSFYSEVTFTAISGTTYYIAVDGYSGDTGPWLAVDTAQGGFTLTWSQLAIYLLEAEDDYNASGSTSVSAGFVIETQNAPVNADPVHGFNPKNATDTLYIQGGRLPPGGHYKVDLLCKYGGSGSDSLACAFYRNGWFYGPWIEVSGIGATSGWVNVAGGHNSGGDGGPVKLGFRSGDVIAIRLFNDGDGGRTWEVDKIRFTLIDSTPPPAISCPKVTGSDLDLGATTHVIDIRESTRTTLDGDLCVTDNGDVYVIILEQGSGTAGTGLVLKKWDGSSWSVISNDVWGNGYPSTTNMAFRVSIDTNGTDVFVVWGEAPRTAPAYAYTGNGVWRCKKWDGASLTELGTGQAGQPGKPTDPNYAAPATYGDDDGPGLVVRCAPDTGYPWVAWCERDTPTNSNSVPYLYHWNGSSWVDAGLPAPATTRGDTGYLIGEVTQDLPWSAMDMTFCHHDGPSNYPAVMYQVFYYTTITDGSGRAREWIYQEYNGSSWSTQLRWIGRDVWGYTGADIFWGSHSGQDAGTWFQSFSLWNDGTHVYCGGPAGHFANQLDAVVVGKLKSDGSAFEAVGTDAAQAQLGYFFSPADLPPWDGVGFRACNVNGRTYIINEDPGNQDGYYIDVDCEIGDDSGWMVASSPPFPSWSSNVDMMAEMVGKKNSLYLLNEVFTDLLTPALGVWKFDIAVGGPVSFSRSRYPHKTTTISVR